MPYHLSIRKIITVIVALAGLIVVSYALWVVYINRPIKAYVFACNEPNQTIKECAYHQADIHYDSMDGIYYLDSLYTDSGKMNFGPSECILNSVLRKIGECQDTTGKKWTLILSGERLW